MQSLCKALEIYGVDPTRLRLEYISVDDGSRFAQLMNEFEVELNEIVTSSSDRLVSL